VLVVKKMIVILTQKHKDDLAFLKGVDVKVLVEFCKMTLEFIRKGQDTQKYSKIFAGAAKKLETSREKIEWGIQALCYLLTEAAKLMLSELDFMDSLIVLAFPDEHNKILKEAYLENKLKIRSILSDLSFELPHYINLDWRLDIKLASRCMHDQVQPTFIFKLDTLEQNETKSQYLQADFTNLKHLHEQLSDALSEMQATYARRIRRMNI